MSNETETPVIEVNDDLDAFSSEFFGENKPDESKPEDIAKSEAEDESDTDDGNETPSESEDVNNEDDDTSEEGSKDNAEKPKSNRFQERISELTAARREAERRANDLEARLAKLENPQPKDDTPAPDRKVETEAGPSPTDKNDDGSDKYPLGEFDPEFIRDLTKFSINQAQTEARKTAADDAERQRLEQEATALQAEWEEKRISASDRYSDYQEKTQALESVFTGIDEQYGNYLAQTLMEMEHGPDVLYHLANNPDEARRIVGLGAKKATIALGRLEAKFDSVETPQPEVRPTKAPTPPPQNKGSGGGRKTVTPDTDDLDAFADLFFKKK